MAQDVSDLVAGEGRDQMSLTPLSAIRKRAAKVSNLWIFDSPKNSKRFTVSGDVSFMHLVLLEGDISVGGYDLVDDAFKVSSKSDGGHVRVRTRDGGQYWLLIRRRQRHQSSDVDNTAIPQSVRERAAEAGVLVHERSELEIAGKEVLFDNWLTLCAIMTRAKDYPTYLHTEQFLAALSRHGTLCVRDVLTMAGVDPAIMLAVVAKALQDGLVRADLQHRFFGLHSSLKRERT